MSEAKNMSGTRASKQPADLKNAEVQLETFLHTLEDRTQTLAAVEEFNAAALAPAITAEIAFDRILQAIFSRGKFAHLSVREVPPGCEDLEPEEWKRQFDENLVDVCDEEIYHVPLETRIMHPEGPDDYADAVRECADGLYDEKLEIVKWCKAERQKEWARDHLKGKAVLLLREWLRAPRPFSLANLAADTIALGLFPRAMNLGSQVTSVQVRNLVNDEVGGGNHLDKARDGVMDSLLAMLVCWELTQDLRNPPNIYVGAREMVLPGLLEAGEQKYDECWFDDHGNRYVLDVLPPAHGPAEMYRGSLAAVAALSVVVQSLAREEKSWIPDNEKLCLEALFARRTSHPMALGMSLSATKAMILRWIKLGSIEDFIYWFYSETLVPALKSLEEELATEHAHAQRHVKDGAPTGGELQKLAFSCRCSACVALVDFLNSGETVRDIQLNDMALRKCLYASAELQGQEDVTAALSRRDTVRLRSRRAEKSRKRKISELETEAVVKRTSTKTNDELAALCKSSECQAGDRTRDLLTYVRDCLKLASDHMET